MDFRQELSPDIHQFIVIQHIYEQTKDMIPTPPVGAMSDIMINRFQFLTKGLPPPNDLSSQTDMTSFSNAVHPSGRGCGCVLL